MNKKTKNTVIELIVSVLLLFGVIALVVYLSKGVISDNNSSGLTVSDEDVSDNTVTYGNLTYALSKDGEYYICTGFAEGAECTGTLSILSVIEEKPVKAISDRAFEHRNDIVEVVLPYNLVSIGEYAFSECKNIDTIRIHVNLKLISSYAFSGCENIKLVDCYFNKAVINFFPIFYGDGNEYFSSAQFNFTNNATLL